MLILTIRTDKPEAEIGLYEENKKLAYETWQAHRELSLTIHQKILELLESNQKHFTDLNGIVCWQGPGSFTGLRIGLSVANALAYGLEIPIIGATGQNWQTEGTNKLKQGKNKLGKVTDFATELSTMFVQKIYVSQPLLRNLAGGTLSVDRSQIVEITNRKIVVQDPLQPTKAGARATAPAIPSS